MPTFNRCMGHATSVCLYHNQGSSADLKAIEPGHDTHPCILTLTGLPRDQKLLSKLEDVAIKDPQVALLLLRMCGSFSKLVHLARTTPTTLVSEAFQQFDTDVKYCLSSCIANGISDSAWHQAQISLSRSGLGLWSLLSAAFIASFCSSGFAASENSHLIQAVARFNGLVPPSDSITETSLVASPPSQRSLSIKLDHFDFQLLFDQSSLADKARLLSISAPHAASWLSVIPSVGLGLHLDPDECQTAVKWWLGIETPCGSNCALCPDSALDLLAIMLRLANVVVMLSSDTTN